jgi:hypothetical protein
MPEPAAAPSLPDPIRRGPDPALGPPPPIGRLQPFSPNAEPVFRVLDPYATQTSPPRIHLTAPKDHSTTQHAPGHGRHHSGAGNPPHARFSTASETQAQPVRTRHHPTPGDFGTAVYCPVSGSLLRPFVRFSKTVRPDTTSAVPAHRPIGLQDTLRPRHTRWEAPGTIGTADPTVCPGPNTDPAGGRTQ